MEKNIKNTIKKKIDDKIYNFLLRSNGTKRSIDSFKKNKIIFLLSYDKKKIIGCIPLEKRPIKRKGKKINSYFITNAYIKKKYQNLKIGSNLLNFGKKKTKDSYICI